MGKALRYLSRRFGILAPRLSVRTHVAWYWRWLGIIVALGGSIAMAIWMYEAGTRFAGFDRQVANQEKGELARGLALARTELDHLRASVSATESRLAIERTTQLRLAEQIRRLEKENGSLREDLATFESMVSSDARNAQSLTIYRFKVVPEVLPGEYRYRLLLLTPSSRREREFQGRLELVVSLKQKGRDAMMIFPQAGDAAASAFRLSFKYFQKVEGIFRISPKATVQSVQVRVFEAGSGNAKVTQTVTPG